MDLTWMCHYKPKLKRQSTHKLTDTPVKKVLCTTVSKEVHAIQSSGTWKDPSLFIFLKTYNSKKCFLSEFLRWSLMIFIIKSFQTIVFIFIVISTMFWPICPPAFFRCLLNSGTYMELRTTSFIESMGVACSDFSRTHSIMVIGIGSWSF